MIKKLLNSILQSATSNTSEERRAELYRNLIRHEAKIGGEIFGSNDNIRREFFCLDEHTIVWHEEKTLPDNSIDVKTVRYDVRPSGVLKMANNGFYQSVSREEADRLLSAVKLYKQRVHKELYPFVPA